MKPGLRPPPRRTHRGGNPSNHSAAVTFTATVTGAAPTGSVTFYNGSAILGSAALNGSGTGFTHHPRTDPGWSAITASYPGDAANAPKPHVPHRCSKPSIPHQETAN